MYLHQIFIGYLGVLKMNGTRLHFGFMHINRFRGAFIKVKY
jgi:hypothetical protein